MYVCRSLCAYMYVGHCMHMHVFTEVGHLKQEHRVVAHSLTMAEFVDVTMQDLMSNEACEELKIHFVRPKGRPNDWSGSVVIHTRKWRRNGADKDWSHKDKVLQLVLKEMGRD